MGGGKVGSSGLAGFVKKIRKEKGKKRRGWREYANEDGKGVALHKGPKQFLNVVGFMWKVERVGKQWKGRRWGREDDLKDGRKGEWEE